MCRMHLRPYDCTLEKILIFMLHIYMETSNCEEYWAQTVFTMNLDNKREKMRSTFYVREDLDFLARI